MCCDENFLDVLEILKCDKNFLVVSRSLENAEIVIKIFERE